MSNHSQIIAGLTFKQNKTVFEVLGKKWADSSNHTYTRLGINCWAVNYMAQGKKGLMEKEIRRTHIWRFF